MILVIENDAARIEGFRRAFGDHIETAMTGFDGIVAIDSTPHVWTRIFLDCDGVQGEQIASDLAAMDRELFLDSLKIIIHSSNYTGAIKMRDVLAKAGYDVELKSFAEIIGDDTED